MTDSATQMSATSRLPQASVVFIALCNFLVTFDITAVVVAMPVIRDELALDVSGFAWVMDAYSLTFAVLLLAAGVLADRYGRRRALLVGLSVFLIASLVCAAAPGAAWLWVGRVLQGVGAAFVICGGLSLLATLHPVPADRVRAFALAGMIGGAAMAVGPTGGGFITDWLGWRWVFWINLPLTVAIALGVIASVEPDEPRGEEADRIDLAGVASFTLFLGVTIWVLLHGPTIGDLHLPNVAGVLVPLLALALFMATQILQQEPVFGLALFRSAAFLGMCTIPVGLSLGYWSMLVYLPLFLGEAMGQSIGVVSVWMLAITAPMIVLPLLGARIALKVGERRFFVGGLLVLAVGCGLIAIGASRANLLVAVAGMALAGCGTATVNAQVSGAIVAMVPRERAGTASAIATTLRQGGFALGIALLGAVLARGAGVADMPTAFTAADFVPVFLTAAGGALLTAAAVLALVPSKTTETEPPAA